eukprot:2639500-Prymnesium_polylepis.1
MRGALLLAWVVGCEASHGSTIDGISDGLLRQYLLNSTRYDKHVRPGKSNRTVAPGPADDVT